MRIKEHPILTFSNKQEILFYFEDQAVKGYEGDTIASALHALGIKVLSYSSHSHHPRGFFCAIGNCSSCHMIVDGIPNVKTCITPLKPNMHVNRQTNKGVYTHDT